MEFGGVSEQGGGTNNKIFQCLLAADLLKGGEEVNLAYKYKGRRTDQRLSNNRFKDCASGCAKLNIFISAGSNYEREKLTEDSLRSCISE